MERTIDEKYKNIISLPHHVSTKHPPMSRQNRAAQFAPFAALVGHDAAVEETARFTSDKKEIDDNLKEILDEKLQDIINHSKENSQVTITYFEADKRKIGGKYNTVTDVIKKIDEINNRIILQDRGIIPIIDIIDICKND